LLFNDLVHVTLHSDALSATLRCDTSNVKEHDAIGTLAICRTRDGSKQSLARLTRARKTGEATIQRATGEASEVVLETAAPVIAVIP
jgi:hypothetical protein